MNMLLGNLPLSRCLLCSSLLFTAIPALADSMGGACDMRQLSLSASQQEQLRQIRANYRAQVGSISNQSRVGRYSVPSAALVLSMPEFDENLARQYVNNKYAPQMLRDLEAMKAQHTMLQVLTPQQRNEWLTHCLR